MGERVLISGAGGHLAQAIASLAPPGYECILRTRSELDIRDELAVAAALRQTGARIVINGAAYNQVDAAERHGMEAAFRINAIGPGRLASACRAADAMLVHFSTDLVFDGAKRTPYTEDDIAAPVGAYGASKLAGEHLVLAASPRNLVIRVSRLFGPAPLAPAGALVQGPGNFPLLMLSLAHERKSVRVVNDQVGSPTYTSDLAVAVWTLINESAAGLFHLSNSGEVAFADYALEIFRLCGVQCDVEAVSTDDYGAVANRPLYSTLSNAKATAFGIPPLRHWHDALEEFLAGYVA